MKAKTKKRLLWGCGSIVSIVVILILLLFGAILYFSQDDSIAQNPKKIADEAGFDLPAYTVIYQNDNMDRAASAWSSYEWKLKVNEPLEKTVIDQLNKLVNEDSNWSYSPESHTYEYSIEEEDRYFSITINVDESEVHMDYNWYDILS